MMLRFVLLVVSLTCGVPLSRVAQTTTVRVLDICCRYGCRTIVTDGVWPPGGTMVESFFNAPGELFRYRCGDSTI